MKSIGIGIKFVIVDAIVLLLIFGLGIFSIIQLAALADFNRYFTSEILPSVKISGSLDAELSSIRRSDAEHLLTSSQPVKFAAERSIQDSRRIISSDLRSLHVVSHLAEDQSTIAAVNQEMLQFLQENDEFLALSRSDRNAEA